MKSDYRTQRIILEITDALQQFEPPAPQEALAGKLTRLNPNTGRGACQGKAPHKPLLLLALIDLAESGELTTRSSTRSPGLVLRFRSYGSIVAGSVTLPALTLTGAD